MCEGCWRGSRVDTVSGDGRFRSDVSDSQPTDSRTVAWFMETGRINSGRCLVNCDIQHRLRVMLYCADNAGSAPGHLEVTLFS